MAPGLDELVFRAQERLELAQVHIATTVSTSKEYALRLHQFILETWNSPALQEALSRAGQNAREAGSRVTQLTQQAWEAAGLRDLPSAAEILTRLNDLFRDRLWRKTALVFICGVACGSVVGVSVGYCWGSRIMAVPHFRALHSLRDGTAVVVEDSMGAVVRRPTDVVISVKAFSIQPEDRAVLDGRGKRLRTLCRGTHQDVTIGRSFSGVVTEMGPAVTRLDIGDEVWGALGDWEGGAACEVVSRPAHRLGRSPRALPPEAAASLPHSGSLALHALHYSGLSAHTAKGKRVLVMGAGSGPGCVILQLLKAWGALSTAVCDPRARPLVTALGATEVVAVEWHDDNERVANTTACAQLYAELGIRAPWDAWLVCSAPRVAAPPPSALLRPAARPADLRANPLATDALPRPLTALYWLYLTGRTLFNWARGVNTDLDFLLPVPLDAEMLDRIAAHVEAGNLQTVVDKVYSLQDFELALAHSCSIGAIGSTVVRMS